MTAHKPDLTDKLFLTDWHKPAFEVGDFQIEGMTAAQYIGAYGNDSTAAQLLQAEARATLVPPSVSSSTSSGITPKVPRAKARTHRLPDAEMEKELYRALVENDNDNDTFLPPPSNYWMDKLLVSPYRVEQAWDNDTEMEGISTPMTMPQPMELPKQRVIRDVPLYDPNLYKFRTDEECMFWAGKMNEPVQDVTDPEKLIGMVLNRIKAGKIAIKWDVFKGMVRRARLLTQGNFLEQGTESKMKRFLLARLRSEMNDVDPELFKGRGAVYRDAKGSWDAHIDLWGIVPGKRF